MKTPRDIAVHASGFVALAFAFAFALPALGAQGDRPRDPPKAPPPAAVVPTPPPGPKAPRPSAVEGGSLYAIQERKYRPGHEFRVAGGYLPQDAFYKGTTLDLSYAYHFNDFFSWEALRGMYSDNKDTDLTTRLRTEFKVVNDPYEKVQYMLMSHFQLTPFYGKQTWMNRGVLHQELYFLAGPSGVGWVIHENGHADHQKNFRPSVDLGFGFRAYASKLVSLKLEAFENFYKKEDGSIDEQAYVTLVLSFSSGR
jgi:outer membrane beta-barrel protein